MSLALKSVLEILATYLTIETGIMSNVQEVSGVVKNVKSKIDTKQYGYTVDYGKISEKLESFYSAADDFISKDYMEHSGNVISKDDRDFFVKKFYEKHPWCLEQKTELDNKVLNPYLDSLEIELKKRMSYGETITFKIVLEILQSVKKEWKSIQEVQRNTQETKDVAIETNYTVKELGARIKSFLEQDSQQRNPYTHQKNHNPNYDLSSSPASEPEPDILDFLHVRQIAPDLFVNWKTGCLASDFRSAVDGRDTFGNSFSYLDNVQDQDSPSLLRLLSILVQGEGAVVSWEELFWRGDLIKEWKKQCEMKGGDGGEIKWYDIVNITEKSIMKLEKAIQDAWNRIQVLRKNSGLDMGTIIEEAENGKGYRIRLFQDNREGLFSGYESFHGYSKYNDFSMLRDISENYGKENRPLQAVAWLRRYYSMSCSNFENRISNRGSQRVDSKEHMIFGDFKMIQAYITPYAKTTDGGQGDALLDYVEKWHYKRGEYGRVLLLHGQPGDGKTTFCKKAVYAHCKEGWLASTPHVLQFSLNPVDSEIISDTNGKKELCLQKAFCIRDEYYDNGNLYTLDFMEMSRVLKCGEDDGALCGLLIILDGYDELAASLEDAGFSFKDFCDHVIEFAIRYGCNVVLTSRTMCIEADLKGEMSDYFEEEPIAFAPLDEEKQDAMIDRMIEIEKDSVKKKTLKEYQVILNDLRKNDDANLADFKELLKIPILFRMIVNIRFRQFKGISTVADLYGSLFYGLLFQKDNKIDEKNKERLINGYEEIAIRIFNYGNGICPFESEYLNRELVYSFYTKTLEDGKEYLGFLHNSFYQYFLARYIISSVRILNEMLIEEKKCSEGKGQQLKNHLVAFEKLFASLSAEKLVDPDMWKLVEQLAKSDWEERNRIGKNLLYHPFRDRIQKKHIKNLLDCMNEGDCFSLRILKENPFPKRDSSSSYKEIENSFYNLLCACVAIENGCIEGECPEENNSIMLAGSNTNMGIKRIAYRGYPHISELIKCGDFSSICLNGIDLESCDLEYAKLDGARLAGANMKGAKLKGVNLKGANLEHAHLKSADLEEAELQGANLIEAEMEKVGRNDTDSKDTDHLEINLSQLILEKTEQTEKLRRKGANLRDANLQRVRLQNAQLNGVDVRGANLVEAHLENTQLNGADMRGANLIEAHLENTQLNGADMRGANLEEAHLENAQLYGADMRGANLKRAHLEGANLSHACLAGACLAGAWLTGVDMERANLERACFEKAHACMDKAKQGNTGFHNACLKDVYFKGAELDKEAFDSMVSADLRGAVFDAVQIEQALDYGMSDLEIRTQTGNGHVVSEALLKRYVKVISDYEVRTKKEDVHTAEGLLKKLVKKKAYKEIKNIKIGDRVWFGRYMQDKKSEEGNFVHEPLLWRVLYVDKEKNKALLITENLIDCRRYHDKRKNVTWERCALRKWMNGYFIKEAFTAQEESLIAGVWNPNHIIKKYDMMGGNATFDMVFALSLDEAGSYFYNNDDRMAAATCYAIEQRSDTSSTHNVGDRETGWWWLRSSGLNGHLAAFVFFDGDVSGGGDGVDNPAGSVRPALWLNL